MTSTPGYITGKQSILIRLRRIEGQVRGLQHQVEDDTGRGQPGDRPARPL